MVVEIATATLFGLLAVHFGLDWALPAYCVLAAGLVALSWIDLHTKRLPRSIIYVTAALGIPLLCVAALAHHEPRRILTMLIGAAIALALMGFIYVASRGGMGDGDVRLAPLLGAFLGWLNPGLAPVGLFFGFFAGSVVGVVLLAIGAAGRKTAVPFGPFLALGAMVAVFYGQECIDLLLHR